MGGAKALAVPFPERGGSDAVMNGAQTPPQTRKMLAPFPLHRVRIADDLRGLRIAPAQQLLRLTAGGKVLDVPEHRHLQSAQDPTRQQMHFQSIAVNQLRPHVSCHP